MIGAAGPRWWFMQFVLNNWYLFLALIVVLAMLIAPLLMQRLSGIESVTPAQAVLLVNRQSAVVVDVSEPAEYGAGHVPTAINTPLSKFSDFVGTLTRFKQRPLVVACKTGQRSLKAAVLLRKQGFDKVSVLAGGVTAWQRASLPLEK